MHEAVMLTASCALLCTCNIINYTYSKFENDPIHIRTVMRQKVKQGAAFVRYFLFNMVVRHYKCCCFFLFHILMPCKIILFFVYLIFMSLIMLYFLHSTSVLSFYIDVVLRLSIAALISNAPKLQEAV